MLNVIIIILFISRYIRLCNGKANILKCEQYIHENLIVWYFSDIPSEMYTIFAFLYALLNITGGYLPSTWVMVRVTSLVTWGIIEHFLGEGVVVGGGGG